MYAAVGRRLGYPIKLVTTRGKTSGHLFARWDDQKTGERFNIEGSGQGLTTPTDDYFRTGLYDCGPEVEAAGCYLVSKTLRMELAGFVGERAWRWYDVKDWWRCVDSWAWAASLVPKNELYRNALKRCMSEWDKEQRAKKPPGFPLVRVNAVTRQFPDSLPLELEMDICGLTAVHNMLNDPRMEQRHWARMRRGETKQIPVGATAYFAPDTSFKIDLQIR